MFQVVYFVLSLLLYIGAIPYLVYLSFKKKYKHSIPARFFLYKNDSFNSGGVWFHACSLGEVTSLAPLLQSIEEPKISVITNTGYDAAKELSSEVRFLPFEIFLPLWIRNHTTLVVTEAEIWYFLFLFAKKNGIKTVLINARISDRSYPRYKQFAWFYKKVFAQIDVIFAQSDKDATRLKILGAQNVHTMGNIKTLNTPTVSTQIANETGKKLFVLASTHDGEEEIILEALGDFDDKAVVVVPRHPERFAIVERHLQKYAYRYGLSYSRYSQTMSIGSDIVLMDMMGELNSVYSICDVVILGGSFVTKAGGHNPLEPAYFGKPIISGPSYFNQQALYAIVENIAIAKDSDMLKELIQKESYLPTKITQVCDKQMILKEIVSDLTHHMPL